MVFVVVGISVAVCDGAWVAVFTGVSVGSNVAVSVLVVVGMGVSEGLGSVREGVKVGYGVGGIAVGGVDEGIGEVTRIGVDVGCL